MTTRRSRHPREVKAVHPYLLAAALALLTAAGTYLVVRRQNRHLRRALSRERAAARLTQAAQHRDMTVLQARLDDARADQAVLAAADHVLDTALTHHGRDPKEGGLS
jgi:ABC-type nickel/cobalt efflux system permease component RcnA